MRSKTINRTGLQVLIIFLISCAVYLNTLPNEFVYDDNAQVLENPWIRDIKHLPEIFSRNVWSFRTGGTSNYYRPMMHVIYMFTYHVFGFKPWGFHLVNILFHSLNSVLLFLIVKMLSDLQAGWQASLQAGKPAGQSVSSLFSPAFIAALLFATHPIHTEAVSWVAGLPDLSYSLFFLLSFYFYIKAEGQYRGYYVLSLISFFLSTLSKEPALTLPFVLIANDYAFGIKTGNITNRLVRYVPYVLIGGIYVSLRVHALNGLIPNASYENSASSNYMIDVFPLFTEYLKDLLFPINPRFWHSFHPLESIFTAKGMISLAITCAYAMLCVAAWKKNRAVFLCLLFIVLPLLPAFYIKGISAKPYAERYLYLSSGGFVMLAAMLIVSLTHKIRRRGLIIAIMAISLTGLYSIQTIKRNAVWKNDLRLFSDTVSTSPDAALPRRQLGGILFNMGRLDEAIEQYRIALSLDENSAAGHANLGLALMKKGLTKEAIKEYQRAVEIDPGDVNVRLELGRAYAKSGSTDKAIEHYRIILKNNPDSVETNTALGAALAAKGSFNDAVAYYEKALSIDPGYAEALYNLGAAYANLGYLDKTVGYFEAAIRSRPDNAFYRNMLGITYGQRGLFDNAVEQFNMAVRLDPSESAYRENLERALKMKESSPEKNK